VEGSEEMGEFPDFPTAAVAATEAACGTPVELKEISYRRGAAVWKAAGPEGAVAVKAGDGEGAAVTQREAAVLKEIGRPGYLLASGGDEGVTWLVTSWFAGPSTWQVFAPVRGAADGKDGALVASVDLCRAVAALHSSGWIHADLQPSHGIHTDHGVRLIDCSWSWRTGTEPAAGFRGGITHLVAPELAASIEAGLQPVTPSLAADVYALAGTLWTCLTGRWPLDYAAAGIEPDQLTPAEVRAHISGRRVPLDTAAPWPAFQDILRPALLGRAGDRPAAAELAEALAKVAG
jgi:serine/threonine protein kinase